MKHFANTADAWLGSAMRYPAHCDNCSAIVFCHNDSSTAQAATVLAKRQPAIVLGTRVESMLKQMTALPRGLA